jgi:hypothetical protein
VLIYPNEKIVEQYILDENGKYGTPNIYNEKDIFHSTIFPELQLIMADIFS